MLSVTSACSSIGTKFSGVSRGLAAIAAFFVFMGAAHAAAPLAGTNIGNQASASYVDQANVTQNVTSNIVTTIVQQVAALTLTSDLAKTVTAGSQVSYPLTLTNTGNGADTYNLTENNNVTGAFNFTSVTFYADANGDGVADNTTPISATTALAPGAVFRFVLVGNVPTTATSGQIDTIVVTARSVFAPATLATVTDTTTITNNAVINVNKSMSAISGASPSTAPHTITLNYSNTGNTAASNVTLTDALPAGMTYAAGSGRWSVTGTTVLTDATGAAQGTGPTIDYSVTGSTVTGIINTVAAGQSGTVTFQVNIASGLPAGVLNNTATYSYSDGGSPAATVGPVNTNTFVFTVNQTASVTFTGQTIASATQGSTVTFNNTLTNTGNASDSFDITVGTGFPAGSAYTLYKSDGVTPLVDTNGNSTPDTGLVAAGATYTVVLKVTLPASATGGPYSVSKTATSKFDPTQAAVATDTLTLITANTVDLTNGGALGAGAGTPAIITTNSTNPGTTTRFTLNANNTGATGDTYNLAVTSVLPAGWTVVFRDTAGVVNLTPGTGTVVTNTGVVAGAASKLIYADVTVPAGQAAIVSPGQSIVFRVTSPSTGATDVKTDAVIINTVRSVVLVPNNIGQVFPGGPVVYTHTITNEGNVVENGVGGSTILLSLAESQASGFTSIVYLDVNNNNVIDDGTDVVINSAADLGTFAINQSKQLLVKVFAGAGVGIGVVNTTTLTATTAGLINGVAAPSVVFATDATTVITGNMELLKTQALDVNCNGSLADPGDTAFSAATITVGAVPGACIRYRITATNKGGATVTGLVVSDSTPASTTYTSTVAAATSLGTVTAPANGAAGTISATVGTLTPSASVVLNFGVRIDPL